MVAWVGGGEVQWSMELHKMDAVGGSKPSG
jgi:hypothetical protein